MGRVCALSFFVVGAAVMGDLAALAQTVSDRADEVPPVLNFTVRDIDGREVSLAKYRGRVVLVVNVASKCGLTPQYGELESLHEKYAARGLSILAFPCNQFGGQEPGSEADIKAFCAKNYAVKFDLFAKIDVNGGKRSPLYHYLTRQATEPVGAGDISWNFEKFLIDRRGQLIARFGPRTAPSDAALLKLLEGALDVPGESGADGAN